MLPKGFCGCIWVSMDTYALPWVLMYTCGWVLVGAPVDACVCLWVFVGDCGYLWVLVGAYGCLWVLVGACGCLWVLLWVLVGDYRILRISTGRL